MEGDLLTPATKSANVTKDLWKYLATTLIAVLLGMFLQTLRQPTLPTDLVPEKELNSRLLELQGKVDAQTREIVALRASINQQSVDIATIATKVGSTAHPVVAPTD